MSDDPANPPHPRPAIPVDEPLEPLQAIPVEDDPATISFPQPAAPPPPLPAAPSPDLYPPPLANPAPPPQQAPAPPPPPPPDYYPPPYAGHVNYRSHAHLASGRPGVITAIGVLSIVVAAVGFVASLFSGCTGLMVMGTTQRGAFAAAARTNTVAVTPTAATQPSATGLPANERRVVVRAFRSRMTGRLASARERALDKLLAEHGQDILGDTITPLKHQDVLDHLGEVGTEFAAPGKTSPDFFVVKQGPLVDTPGRIVLHDTYALYYSDDGFTRLRSDLDTGATPTQQTVTFQPIGIAEAQAVVNQAALLSNQTLNPAQAATLRNLLLSPGNENWITHASNIPGLTAQVRSAVRHNDGSITVTFISGQLTLDPAGNLVGGPPNIANTGPTTTPAGPPLFAGPVISANRTSSGLVILEASLSALMAVFLLIVGIFTLRQSPASRWLLLIYAVGKTLLGVLAIAALSWMIRSVTATPDAFGTSTAFANTIQGFGVAALVLASIGILFPVSVLLVLLGNRRVRDYFKMTA